MFRFGEDYFYSNAEHPFLAFWWIENNSGLEREYVIQVRQWRQTTVGFITYFLTIIFVYSVKY